MIEIKDLLARFDTLLTSGEAQKDFVRSVISETIGLEIPKENINIKNNIIYLNIKPIYKNQIFIKSDEIARKLKEYFGKKSPSSIR